MLDLPPPQCPHCISGIMGHALLCCCAFSFGAQPGELFAPRFSWVGPVGSDASSLSLPVVPSGLRLGSAPARWPRPRVGRGTRDVRAFPFRLWSGRVRADGARVREAQATNPAGCRSRGEALPRVPAAASGGCGAALRCGAGGGSGFCCCISALFYFFFLIFYK